MTCLRSELFCIETALPKPDPDFDEPRARRAGRDPSGTYDTQRRKFCADEKARAAALLLDKKWSRPMRMPDHHSDERVVAIRRHERP